MVTFTKRGYAVFAARDANDDNRSVVNAEAVTWSTEIEQALSIAGLSDVASGTLAQRDDYDDEAAGFLFIQVDGTDDKWFLHRKASATSGDWDSSPQALFQGVFPSIENLPEA